MGKFGRLPCMWLLTVAMALSFLPAFVQASPLASLLPNDTCTQRMLRAAMAPMIKQPSPDAHLRTPQLITKYGYPVEEHQVTSGDGYILTMFRIPTGKGGAANASAVPGKPKPAVLLMHGLWSSSSDWLMQPEESCLPYLLANEGYDVWLGNARGSSYSNRHVNLSSSGLEYWKFSWHEMGAYDVPALIDHILDTTKEPALYYIGHSMGSTVFFVAMSLHPEYNTKIRSFYGLAPAAYVANLATPLVMLEPIAKPIHLLQAAVGMGESLPPVILTLVHAIGPILCAPSPVALNLCGLGFFFIAGFDPCQLDATEVGNIAGHTPDTTSARTLLHFLQLRHSRGFHAYDFGTPEANERIYGAGNGKPPAYDLSRVTARAAIFWGQNDLLTVPEDVATLVEQLPNVIANHRVAYGLWSHLDFLYGLDARRLVYTHVLRLMQENYET